MGVFDTIIMKSLKNMSGLLCKHDKLLISILNRVLRYHPFIDKNS